ncbi:HD domain-containing protein [Paraglaciecola aestuariivivens]
MIVNNYAHYSQPLLADTFNHHRFKGSYYLIGFVAKIDKNGQQFWEITLSDATGLLKIYCRDQSCIVEKIKPQSLVDVEACADNRGKVPYFRCKFIQASTLDLSRPRAISQLPMTLCEKPEALIALLQLIDSISQPLLVEFVTNVLTQPHIGLQFIRCPASANHHHNYVSGLLDHSVEVASKLSVELENNHQERDLAIVAALFHDIGKTQTFTPCGQRTAIGYVVDHNDLTLEICAPALKILNTKHAVLANKLRHAWTCASEGSRYGYKAKTLTARLLKRFDRQSAVSAINATN